MEKNVRHSVVSNGQAEKPSKELHPVASYQDPKLRRVNLNQNHMLSWIISVPGIL